MTDPDHDALARLLEGYYAEVGAAFRRKDIEGIARFLTADFVAYERGGTKVARAETLAGFARMLETLRDITWERKVRSLVVVGDRATATVHGVFEATSTGPDGKPAPFAFDITAEDVWVRSGETWKTQCARSLGRHELPRAVPS